MAGAACKIIIDDLIRSLNSSLEQVLMSPLVRDNMLSACECDKLIQRMANIDLRTYVGAEVENTMQGDGLVEILKTLQRCGVITSEVWVILNRGDSNISPEEAEGIDLNSVE